MRTSDFIKSFQAQFHESYGAGRMDRVFRILRKAGAMGRYYDELTSTQVALLVLTLETIQHTGFRDRNGFVLTTYEVEGIKACTEVLDCIERSITLKGVHIIKGMEIVIENANGRSKVIHLSTAFFSKLRECMGIKSYV